MGRAVRSAFGDGMNAFPRSCRGGAFLLSRVPLWRGSRRLFLPAGIAAMLAVGCASSPPVRTVSLVNAGFENGWQGWQRGDGRGSSTTLSDDANEGDRAAHLSSKPAFVSQVVPVQPASVYRLTASISGGGNLGVKVGEDLYFDQGSPKKRGWQRLSVKFSSQQRREVSVFCSSGGGAVRCDDFRLEVLDGATADLSPRLKSSSAGGSGLSPDLPPGRNFDLLDWKLNTPADANNDGKADLISEVALAGGATDDPFFYTADDGGMVFRATVAGARTSKNTRFTRTELREMLRRGDKSISTKTADGTPNANNWVFSSAPTSAQKAAGGVDGVLRATLAVNHVTTTGERSQVGRVIVGQIHAKKDEPARLYYRKLPEHTRGSLYVAHEPSGQPDQFYELIGTRAQSGPEPDNGIRLDEKFTYEIAVSGHQLKVTILQGDDVRATQTIDMSGSGYDVADDYMYFKAGVYNQNNTGDADDYVQATFYSLDNRHGHEDRR